MGRPGRAARAAPDWRQDSAAALGGTRAASKS